MPKVSEHKTGPGYINIKIEPELFNALVDRAKENYRTISGEVRLILDEYLKQ